MSYQGSLKIYNADLKCTQIERMENHNPCKGNEKETWDNNISDKIDFKTNTVRGDNEQCIMMEINPQRFNTCNGKK